MSTLNARIEKERFELKPSKESKVYYKAHMDERDRLIQKIAAGATIIAVPAGVAALCSIM